MKVFILRHHNTTVLSRHLPHVWVRRATASKQSYMQGVRKHIGQLRDQYF